MTLQELYAQYGQFMVELEIAQSKVNQVKQQIVQELNKPKEAVTGEIKRDDNA